MKQKICQPGKTFQEVGIEDVRDLVVSSHRRRLSRSCKRHFLKIDDPITMATRATNKAMAKIV